MSTGVISPEEVRAEFARTLRRRFQGMTASSEFGCVCRPARQGDHEKPCPGYYWERASWMTEVLLAEQNGALDAHG